VTVERHAAACGAAWTVSFADFTVPQYQRDDSYSASLAELTVIRVPSSISRWCRITPTSRRGRHREQVRLIEAAPGGPARRPPRLGVSAPRRGMDRAGREEIPRLLDLHREIIARGKRERSYIDAMADETASQTASTYLGEKVVERLLWLTWPCVTAYGGCPSSPPARGGRCPPPAIPPG